VGASLARWSEHFCDRSQHSLTVGEYFIVPEPKNAPPLPPQLAVAQVIVASARMLAAIGLDDQARLNASKIHNVWRDQELASKSPAELILTEFFPEELLGICHISAQRTRLFLH
jgi:hypothetical protein